MRKRLTLLAAAAIVLAFPLRIRAQYTLLDLPRASQMASVSQRIGTTDIRVDYSRPAVKGRQVWGAMVPYDQVWRAGANENTVITFGNDVQVEGKALKAGTYGLHMLPTKTTWTVILSNDHSAWGSYYYKPEQDALRVTVTPKASVMTENLTYTFDDVTDQGATLALRWAELDIPVKITVDVHAQVLAGMDAQLRGLSSYGWESWYEAAHYAHQEKIGGDKVMKWVDRSIALRPNFENQNLKAELLAEQGRTAEADALHTKMLDVATNNELNSYGYALLNQGKKAEAVKVLELNAKRHANDPNVHDSLGEAYMMNGQKDAAIKSFKKSLSMDPVEGVRANSVKCLKQLGVDTSAYEKTAAVKTGK
jgi:tetratricopeptide (TPR) repeat protein